MSTTTTQFRATSDVPCRLCGDDTIPPYTDANGERHEHSYCEACGTLTETRRPVLTVVKTHPTRCTLHPAYEASYCPTCGTAAAIGNTVWADTDGGAR